MFVFYFIICSLRNVWKSVSIVIAAVIINTKWPFAQRMVDAKFWDQSTLIKTGNSPNQSRDMLKSYILQFYTVNQFTNNHKWMKKLK